MKPIPRCSKHKTYRAIRPPRAACNACWTRWQKTFLANQEIQKKQLKILSKCPPVTPNDLAAGVDIYDIDRYTLEVLETQRRRLYE